MIFANFLRSQFGVQTMAYYGCGFRGDDDKARQSGTYALHTLSDDETIARLATGIKRFKVPDEFNWIKIYQRVAGRGKSDLRRAGPRRAGRRVFEDRRQYVKAADAWKKAIDEYGPGPDNYRQQRLDQIVGNWGRFEPGEMQPAGKQGRPSISASATATRSPSRPTPSRSPSCSTTSRPTSRATPAQLDWNQINIGNIGYRLVEQQRDSNTWATRSPPGTWT